MFLLNGISKTTIYQLKAFGTNIQSHSHNQLIIQLEVYYAIFNI